MWLRENLPNKNTYMIIMGVFMDIMILTSVGVWAYRHRTARLVPTMLMFYELRG